MLCEPLFYTGDTPVLSSRRTDNRVISLQHVGSDNDIPFIFDLLKKETDQKWDIALLLDSFKESFAYIAGSHASQAFIIKLDGEPLFEIETHEARKHVDLHAGFHPGEGDYFITLLAGLLDQAAFEAYLEGFRLCLDFFFSYPEVKRIVIPLYTGNDRLQRARLLSEAGIRLLLEKTSPTEPDLFMIARPPSTAHAYTGT